MVTTILAKMLEPALEAMPAEFARVLLNLRVDEHLQSRIEALRYKANAGQLSGDESQEYQEFIEAVDVVSFLQLKARRVIESDRAQPS